MVCQEECVLVWVDYIDMVFSRELYHCPIAALIWIDPWVQKVKTFVSGLALLITTSQHINTTNLWIYFSTSKYAQLAFISAICEDCYLTLWFKSTINQNHKITTTITSLYRDTNFILQIELFEILLIQPVLSYESLKWNL